VDVRAGELDLHPLTAEEAERVLRGQVAPGESWAAGYPSMVQVQYLRAYVIESRSAEREHHWQCQLRRRSDGLVVGGAGVTGPVDAEGAVVIGYELVDELSDTVHGLHIVLALIEIARGMGATRVTTDLFDHDQVRRHVYFGAGLNEVRREGHVVYLAADI
jgi:hypothetical protein